MKTAYLILALTFALMATFIVTSIPNVTTVVAPDPIPTPCDFACLVEQRTLAIFERDRLDYLEQSRLKALTEINQESQQMVYESPYIQL